ncbi:DUF2510 domain-containing protein [Nocardia flavorosea]|uniref:DUF2510 domain-containing protein n=1 Tax=Nocardia flavorosea TaxID=53429 RepID=A0A846YC44_9NOCA|nr:DUF2510 domain-containing protein [Nocardia flavorosea]
MGTFSIWHFVILFVAFLSLAVAVVVVVRVTRSGRPRQPQPPTAVQPGWYPDNLNPAQLRWFDGYQWTDQVQQR